MCTLEGVRSVVVQPVAELVVVLVFKVSSAVGISP